MRPGWGGGREIDPAKTLNRPQWKTLRNVKKSINFGLLTNCVFIRFTAFPAEKDDPNGHSYNTEVTHL